MIKQIIALIIVIIIVLIVLNAIFALMFFNSFDRIGDTFTDFMGGTSNSEITSSRDKSIVENIFTRLM